MRKEKYENVGLRKIIRISIMMLMPLIASFMHPLAGLIAAIIYVLLTAFPRLQMCDIRDDRT